MPHTVCVYIYIFPILLYRQNIDILFKFYSPYFINFFPFS